MLQLPVSDVIKKICEDKSLAEKEVKAKIQAKRTELGDLVSEEGAAYIIASELGVTIFKEIEAGATYKIKDIIAGMRNVDTIGKVLQTFEPRTFKKQDKVGQVGSLILADETGKIRVTIWDDRVAWLKSGKIKSGQVIKIKGAYAKEAMGGGRDLHLSFRSQLTLDVNEDIKVSNEPQGYDSKKVVDINPEDRVQVIGTVVQAFSPHFYNVCPECGKKVNPDEGGYMCAEHKQVTPKHAMIVSFVLDDGTDSIRCVAFKELASKLINMSPEEVQTVLETQDDVALQDALNKFLLGRIVDAQGRANYNKAFARKEFIVDKVFLDPDPKAIAERMLRSKNG